MYVFWTDPLRAYSGFPIENGNGFLVIFCYQVTKKIFFVASLKPKFNIDDEMKREKKCKIPLSCCR